MGRNKDRIEEITEELKQLRAEVQQMARGKEKSAPASSSSANTPDQRAPFVILAIADDQYGRAIIEFLHQRTWPQNTVFELVTVLEPAALTEMACFPDLAEQVAAEQRRAADKLLTDMTDEIEQAIPHARVRRKLLSGAPAAEIIDAANNADADLIVVGSHGKTGMRRLVLGSVSLSVVSQARCDVSIVRLEKSWGSAPEPTTYAKPQTTAEADFSPLRADTAAEQSRH